MTREMIFRMFFNLLLMFTGFNLMTGGCDELSSYLSQGQQQLLGAALFFCFSWWFYSSVKWQIQHDLDYVRIYDQPLNFYGHKFEQEP